MKKIFIIVFLFLIITCNEIIYAQDYITYSDWQEEYPYWLDSIFIESEDRYLWINTTTGEETTEYYKELDGYTKIEESKKTFYRYITNKTVLFNSKGEIVYDMTYCYKSFCTRKTIPEKPTEPEEIINPKTYDNIYVFLILSFLSFVSLVLISFKKINLVMSNQFKKQ